MARELGHDDGLVCRTARGNSSSSVAVVVEAASRSKGMSSGSNAPALRSEDEAVRRGRATAMCEELGKFERGVAEMRASIAHRS